MPADGPPAAILAAAYDMLSVASLRARDPDQELDDASLAALLRLARSHGLTVEQLCDATGLDPDYVTQLIEQASTRRAG